MLLHLLADDRTTKAMVDAVVGQAKILSYWEICLDTIVDAMLA